MRQEACGVASQRPPQPRRRRPGACGSQTSTLPSRRRTSTSGAVDASPNSHNGTKSGQPATSLPPSVVAPSTMSSGRTACRAFIVPQRSSPQLPPTSGPFELPLPPLFLPPAPLPLPCTRKKEAVAGPPVRMSSGWLMVHSWGDPRARGRCKTMMRDESCSATAMTSWHLGTSKDRRYWPTAPDVPCCPQRQALAPQMAQVLRLGPEEPPTP
mmetsp:Transcript_101803/g.303822  ORF Transcript_101803/g.303822 Transcript_101803/m.303822 type:complete len:212 (+) Transcript_101803:97-732(+)